MADVLLRHTPDGGDIEIVNGRITVTSGVLTAVYLALFGGNEEDSGEDAENRKQWWGNLTEPDSAKHYRSRTQHVLRGMPATTGNLKVLRQAVEADLDSLVSDGTLTERSARVALVAPKRALISMQVVADGQAGAVEFESRWEAREGTSWLR